MTVKLLGEKEHCLFLYSVLVHKINSTLTLLMLKVHEAYLTLKLFLALGLSKSRTLSQ